jgi:alanine dehydrogenase
VKNKISIGFARMHAEPGERRDFLPKFVGKLVKRGANVVLEHGYGSGLGLLEENYKKVAPEVVFASSEEVYQQDCVVVLRYPGHKILKQMRSEACLISMIHYPTRPGRVADMRSLGIEAISLDSIKDDSGRRLVENLHAVAWNGTEAAFNALRITYPAPGFGSPDRPPIHVTLLGSGAVGIHVVQAAIRYGNLKAWERMAQAGIPGVHVNVIDYDLTNHEDYMLELLSKTDLLIDATQRPDTSQPVIPNTWIGQTPEHAILLDLSVDPYQCDTQPISVKGIEGIPHGNLDQYIFTPDAKIYEEIPNCIDTTHRRHVVSCYSWPGIRPEACMRHYGKQILPVLRRIIDLGGPTRINPKGTFFERAIARATLSVWVTQRT